MSTRRPFRLVSEHFDGTLIIAFETGAGAAARITPDANGFVYRNLPDSIIEAVEARGFEYCQGQFWFENRYAVVFQHRSTITASRRSSRARKTPPNRPISESTDYGNEENPWPGRCPATCFRSRCSK